MKVVQSPLQRRALRLGLRQRARLNDELIAKFAFELLGGVLRVPKHPAPGLKCLGSGLFTLDAPLLLPGQPGLHLFRRLTRPVDFGDQTSFLHGMPLLGLAQISIAGGQGRCMFPPQHLLARVGLLEEGVEPRDLLLRKSAQPMPLGHMFRQLPLQCLACLLRRGEGRVQAGARLLERSFALCELGLASAQRFFAFTQFGARAIHLLLLNLLGLAPCRLRDGLDSLTPCSPIRAAAATNPGGCGR